MLLLIQGVDWDRWEVLKSLKIEKLGSGQQRRRGQAPKRGLGHAFQAFGGLKLVNPAQTFGPRRTTLSKQAE